jgi:hypothetical protein
MATSGQFLFEYNLQYYVFLSGELRPLTFSVITEKYIVFSVILLFCDIWLFPNPHFLIYLSSLIYYFPYFPGYFLFLF